MREGVSEGERDTEGGREGVKREGGAGSTRTIQFLARVIIA